MGWKRLIAFMTVVAVLASGGHIVEGMNHVTKTAVAGLKSVKGVVAGQASGNSGSGLTGTVGTSGTRKVSGTAAKGPQGSTVQLQTTQWKTGKAAVDPSKPADLTAQSTIDPAVPHDAPIPKDSLRLRIIANSDSAADQQLKREVRNAIVVKVAELVKNAKTEPQAQAIVTKHLASLKALAQKVVHEHGFRYDVKAKVGEVPFPTKVYGNRVYPAGNYKALRFILGKGQGKNWWCVLFPPLCFVDIADGDAVPNTGGFPDLPPLETITIPNMQGKPTKVAVRLASVDYGEELWKTVRQWF